MLVQSRIVGSYCEPNSTYAIFMWFPSMPVKRVFLFSDAAVCSYVNVELPQFMVDDGRILASSTWGRSCESPDIPTREPQSCVFPFIYVLLGAWFTVCSSGFGLSSKHPLKQADFDGSAPYWLEDAQLEADSNDHSHRWRQLVASEHTPIYSGPVTACLPCCFCRYPAALKFLLHGACLGMCMEILRCPIVRTPLSASSMCSKGELSNTFGIGPAAGTAERIPKLVSSHLRSPTPDFMYKCTPMGWLYIIILYYNNIL